MYLHWNVNYTKWSCQQYEEFFYDRDFALNLAVFVTSDKPLNQIEPQNINVEMIINRIKMLDPLQYIFSWTDQRLANAYKMPLYPVHVPVDLIWTPSLDF